MAARKADHPLRRYGSARVLAFANLRKLHHPAGHDHDKCSNGINAVLFALYNGASEVIITGINPDSGGHVYNKENLTRLHARKDREVLERLIERGYPVFTTDPGVSESVGLPLWKGRDADDQARGCVGVAVPRHIQ